MDHPAPLEGDDISAHLRDAKNFGVTLGRAADGVPTVEFTTDPAVHGPHGLVRVRRDAPGVRRLVAEVALPGVAYAQCTSDDSVRVWGRFAPEAELVIRSSEAVRVVARTPAGAVLAGPIVVPPDGPPSALSW